VAQRSAQTLKNNHPPSWNAADNSPEKGDSRMSPDSHRSILRANVGNSKGSVPHFREFICCLLALTLAACSASRLETKIHPNTIYEEIPLQLGLVKPAQDRQGQDKRLLVAVAISGGGERAGNFGIGALIGLEDIALDNPYGKNVLTQVDLFSTVSGGGFAAAIYISSLYDFLNNGGSLDSYSLRSVLAGYSPENRFDPNARRQLERGYEDDAAGFLNPFKSSSWRIWFGDLDRTDLLEKAIDDDLLAAEWRRAKDNGANNDSYSLTLRDVFIPIADENKPFYLPHWVANAAAYENGAIFPFTPEHLIKYRIVEYTHRLEKVRYASKNFNSEQYKEFIFNIPVSLAVTASGNFPVALPATTLQSGLDPENPYLHLLDGGLADNLGVISAIRFLQQNNTQDVEKLLIVVDAYKGRLGPYSKKEGAPSWSKTIGRTTTVFLDSWRGRYREITRSMCEHMGAEVVFVSFEDLADVNDLERLKNLDYSNLENLRLTDADIRELKKKLIKDKSSQTVAADQVTPFDLLRNIATSYNVSPEEQKLLIAAGRRVIKDKETQIKQALSLD
jgi:hypothetical protein